MKNPVKSIVSIFLGTCCSFLVSCAGSLDINALTPTSASAVNRVDAPLRAVVTGGMPRSTVLANISNEDFKNALETSLVKSGMFKSVGSGGYQLDAFITSVDQPPFGISMKVDMEVNYSLSRKGTTVWRKSIKSSYVAPLNEAFVGAVRVRKATEGAARENISLLIRSLNEKRF